MANKNGFRRLGPSMYYKQHRDTIEAAFSSCGAIEKIELDQSKATPTALIYFKSAESVHEAMEADGNLLWNAFKQHTQPVATKGVARALIDKHVSSIPVSESLQLAADKCMALFEKEERLEASRRAMRDGPDDDGFVTVTHKRKSKEIERGAAFQKKVKKGKSLELKNFYRHQIREEKKDKLAELRERFEYDKAQIKKLQDSKRFKP